VITALLPRMSDHAGVRRYSQVRNDFSTGVRLSSVIVVPAALYLGVLGVPVAEFLLAHRQESITSAQYIGEVFGLFSLGLVPYMLTQLQLRVFYSFQASRTAALVGLFTMTVSIAGDLIAYDMLPPSQVVAGMAVAYGAANLIGAIVGWILLLRRVGSLDGWPVARALARIHPGDPAWADLGGLRPTRRRPCHAQPEPGLRHRGHADRRRRRRPSLCLLCPQAPGSRVQIPDGHHRRKVRRPEQPALA
jgi:O-antigen/teichoic acid export membrane protein